MEPYEWDTATTVDGLPAGDYFCVDMTGAEACFEKYGDKWYVKDTKSDGHSATASWINYLSDGRSWIPYRHGSCVNKSGAGKWGLCNKDYYEDSTTNPARGNGSRIQFQACVYDSADGTWHGCSKQEDLFNDQ
jgi:hypothetical protein